MFDCIYCDKESCVLECSIKLTSNNAIMVNQIAPVSEAKLSKVSYFLGNNKMDVTGCNSLPLALFFPPSWRLWKPHG